MTAGETLELFSETVPDAVRTIFDKQVSGQAVSGPDRDVSGLENFYGVKVSFLQDPKTKAWYLAHWEHETDWTPPSVYIRSSDQIKAAVEEMRTRVETNRRNLQADIAANEAGPDAWKTYVEPYRPRPEELSQPQTHYAEDAMRQTSEDIKTEQKYQQTRETVLRAYENALMAINEASRSGKNPLDVLRKSGNRGLEAPAP